MILIKLLLNSIINYLNITLNKQANIKDLHFPIHQDSLNVRQVDRRDV